MFLVCTQVIRDFFLLILIHHIPTRQILRCFYVKNSDWCTTLLCLLLQILLIVGICVRIITCIIHHWTYEYLSYQAITSAYLSNRENNVYATYSAHFATFYDLFPFSFHFLLLFVSQLTWYLIFLIFWVLFLDYVSWFFCSWLVFKRIKSIPNVFSLHSPYFHRYSLSTVMLFLCSVFLFIFSCLNLYAYVQLTDELYGLIKMS